MTRKRTICLMAAILLFMAIPWNVKAEVPVKKLDVMFLHDIHSHVESFAKVKTLIDEQKEEKPDTLLVDAGDFSMGTLIQTLYETEAAELRMMGALGIDATTLGNHEFDFQASGLANMLNKAAKSGDRVPSLVVCNIDWEEMKEEEPELWAAFETYGIQEYVMVEKGDVKIAITGVFGEDALECTPNCPVEFEDPVEAVEETVEKIKEKEEVDMIVCLSHSGISKNKKKSEDEILAKKVPELDLIVSGHTHSTLKKPIVHGDTYIVSAHEYAKNLGSLSMTQQGNGRWKIDSYELMPITEDILEEGEIKKKIQSFISMVDKGYLEQFGLTMDEVLCTNEVKFTTVLDTEESHTEQNLGSFIADAFRYTVETTSDDKRPVDVAVLPGGCIRDTYDLGEIKVSDVFNSFSLGIGQDGITGYPLVSAYLTGKELKLIAEVDASLSQFMIAARLFASGLYWSFDSNGMILNKTKDVYLKDHAGNRVEIEDDKLYRIVTDYYTSQMLGSIEDLSYGLLSLVPKDAEGNPIEDFNDAIIYTDGKELKAWVAIATYMQSFEDTDGDGIGNVPRKYSVPEGRKVADKAPVSAWVKCVLVVVVIISIIVVACILRRKKKRYDRNQKLQERN